MVFAYDPPSKIEDATIAPAKLIVANEASLRNGRECGLAGTVVLLISWRSRLASNVGACNIVHPSSTFFSSPGEGKKRLRANNADQALSVCNRTGIV